MSTIQDILNDLKEFENSPENAGYDLRLDLADIIVRHLDGQKWTQARLAKAAGMKDAYLTRVIHSAQNCTFDVAGRILHALGVQVRLMEVPKESNSAGNYAEKARVAERRSSHDHARVTRRATKRRTRRARR